MLPQVKTILYATGLDAGAPYVFRHALSLARQHQAKIVAVHVIEPLSPFGQSLVEHYISHDTSVEMHKKAQEKVKSQLQERLKQLCSKECDGATECDRLVSSIMVLEGQPAQVIQDTAKSSSANLIVMGAHHHSRISEVMVGSTTRKVLQIADLPVLVVKIPKGCSEELL